MPARCEAVNHEGDHEESGRRKDGKMLNGAMNEMRDAANDVSNVQTTTS